MWSGDKQAKPPSSFNRQKSGQPFFGGITHRAPSSFISTSPDLTKEQQKDETKVRKAIPMAIALLGKAKPFIAVGGQAELFDQLMDVFEKITPDHIGTLGPDKGHIKTGKPEKLFYNFKVPGGMSRPFSYEVRFDVSHEPEGTAAGYFHETGNYGGIIVIKLVKTKSIGPEQLAEILVHETVHMFSHLQRAVKERVGDGESTQVPGRLAGGILNAAAFEPNKKAFAPHFAAIRDFLNTQPYRSDEFSKIPESIIDDWSRMVVDETMAYVYTSRTSLAMGRAETAGKKGPTISMGVGFVPLQFLKNYVTEHWLTDPRDQAAMATKEGDELLKAMSPVMIDLAKAVEAQVGPDQTP
jgi:hypothetical protein